MVTARRSACSSVRRSVRHGAAVIGVVWLVLVGRAGSVSAVPRATAAFATSSEARNGAIRVAQNISGIDLADVIVDGRPRVHALTTLSSGGLSEYLVLTAGRHHLELRSSNATSNTTSNTTSGGLGAEPSAVADIDVVPDSSTVLVVTGDPRTPTLGAVTIDAVAGTARSSVRVLNTSESALTVHVGDRAVALAPMAASGPLPFETATLALRATAAVGDASATLRARSGSESLVVVSVLGGVAIRHFDVRAFPVAALGALEPAMVRHGFAAAVLVDDGLWLRRILAGVVVVLVVLATASTLASFRNETMEDRVRNRMQ